MPEISQFDRFVFIVGAPRCGTTTLSHLLKNHPQVCSPMVKEPHFFAQHDLRELDEDALREIVQRDYLDRFFPACPPGRTVGADSSVTYLYTPEQMAPILKLWPDSRFVIALRDPLEMLPSLHKRLLTLGDEDIRDFEDAWHAVPDRAAGRRIPRRNADPRWLRYDEAGRFGSYVERFFATVGREHCLVVSFDDLTSEPVAVARRLFDFLGLVQPASINIPHKRESKEVRFLWLQRLLKRPPKAIFDLLAPRHHKVRTGLAAARKTGSGGGTSRVMSLRKKLLRWNRRPAVPVPVAPAVRDEIAGALRDEMRKLGHITGRDFSHWLSHGAGSEDAASPGHTRKSARTPAA
jgi:hypothetical protein